VAVGPVELMMVAIREGDSLKLRRKRSAAWLQRADSWVVDYGPARAQAIRWLGERYLLAKPIYGSHHTRRTMPERMTSLPADDGNVLFTASDQ
jgi:hypothetical protein